MIQKDLRRTSETNNSWQFNMWKRNYIIKKQSLDKMTPKMLVVKIVGK